MLRQAQVSIHLHDLMLLANDKLFRRQWLRHEGCGGDGKKDRYRLKDKHRSHDGHAG
jgi:hypothetical protein